MFKISVIYLKLILSEFVNDWVLYNVFSLSVLCTSFRVVQLHWRTRVCAQQEMLWGGIQRTWYAVIFEKKKPKPNSCRMRKPSAWSPTILYLQFLIRNGQSSMQLSTELTPCVCWTVWKWLPGRRGWRWRELYSTWLRVSSQQINVFIVLERVLAPTMGNYENMTDQWGQFCFLHFVSLQGPLQSAALKLRCSTGWDTTFFCCLMWGPSLLWWNF